MSSRLCPSVREQGGWRGGRVSDVFSLSSYASFSPERMFGSCRHALPIKHAWIWITFREDKRGSLSNPKLGIRLCCMNGARLPIPVRPVECVRRMELRNKTYVTLGN